jgi:hypothetical protein
MLDITKDIQSLTTFRTVKGKAAAIVQDAEAFQRLLDMGAQADAEEGIRQGREDVEEGRVRPAREFFAEFKTRRDLPHLVPSRQVDVPHVRHGARQRFSCR